MNYTKLALYLQDLGRSNTAIVFDDIIIKSIGQLFVLTKADENFSSATAFLTNGQQDRIIALSVAPTRIEQIEGNEPDCTFWGSFR